jgi:hypothetical protein
MAVIQQASGHGVCTLRWVLLGTDKVIIPQPSIWRCSELTAIEYARGFRLCTNSLTVTLVELTDNDTSVCHGDSIAIGRIGQCYEH